MSMTPLRWIVALAAASGLTGCGGDDDASAPAPSAQAPGGSTGGTTGGGTSGAPTVALSGSARAAGTRSVKVCLDLGSDGRCDASDPQAPATGGTFTLVGLVPGDVPGRFLLAEYTDTGSGIPALVLTAPALDGIRIDGLSTLAAERFDALSTDARAAHDRAFASVVAEMAAVTVPGATDPSVDARLSALDDASVDSLVRAWGVGQSSRSPTETLHAALRDHARATVPVIARYVDRSTGTLLPTVTSRTLASEVAGTVYPPTCAVEPAARVAIDTLDAAPVVSKSTYVDVTRLVLDANDGSGAPIVVTDAARIRGRGNFTWTLEKKPYKIAFDSATGVFGMPADKEWALLANHTDKTLLRNGVTMCAGRLLELGWVPKFRFAEVTLNGSYDGLYQWFEQVKKAPHRVDLGASPADASDFAAGLLVEINYRLDEDVNFVTSLGVPYSVKEGNTADGGASIRAEIEVMEAALDDRVGHGYVQHLDVESFVDFYILQELVKNFDLLNSSNYVHRARGATRLSFGPLWDFDIALGSALPDPEGLWLDTAQPSGTIRNSIYLVKLLEDPVFRRHVAARWQYLSGRHEVLRSWLTTAAATMRGAVDANFVRWPVLSTVIAPATVALGSHDAELAYVQDWLARRKAWLDAYWQPGF